MKSKSKSIIIIIISAVSALVFYFVPIPIHTFQPIKTYNLNPGSFSLDLSDDGKYMAVGSDKLYFYDTSQSTPLWSYNNIENNIQKVMMSSDGSNIVFVNNLYEYQADKGLYVFDKSSSTPLWINNSIDFDDFSISSNGNYIIARIVGTMYVFSIVSPNALWSYTMIDHCAISDDGKFIATGGTTIRLFNSSSDTPLWEHTPSGVDSYEVEIAGNGDYIIAFSDPKILFFKNSSSTPLWTKENLGINDIKSVDINYNGASIMAFGTTECYSFNSESSTPVMIFPRGRFGKLSSDGKYIAIQNEMGLSFYENSSTFEKWHYFPVNHVFDLTSDGSLIVGGSTDIFRTNKIFFFNRDNFYIPTFIIKIAIIGSLSLLGVAVAVILKRRRK
jgi:hypothetical protein